MLSRMPNQKARDYIEMRVGVPINKFTDYASYLTTGSKKVWATYRACKIISAMMITAKYKIVKEGQEGKVEVTEQYGWFLKKPNPYDSWQEIMEMWVFHMELTGNCYWLKDEPDLLGRPKAIYPLLPQHMEVIPSATNKVSSFRYRVNGRTIDFSPDDIIHYRSTHPTNLIMGMGSVEPSEALYNKFINRDSYEENFMANGAQPSGILIKEDAVENPSQWEGLKKKFQRNYGGKANAGKTAFLNGKWSYEKLGLTMGEMQSLEAEKWTIEQIFLNHGVPLSVAGVDGAANYATAKQDEINFRKYKVVPLLDILVGKVNADGFFKSPLEEFVRFAYELSGLIDVEQIIKEYMPLVKDGAMTRNELRELCELPLSENVMLDQYLIAANVIPIEMAGFSDPSSVLEDEEKALAARRSRAAKEIDLEVV